eukprot:1921774-Pyramimonas_sp.AAC.1
MWFRTFRGSAIPPPSTELKPSLPSSGAGPGTFATRRAPPPPWARESWSQVLNAVSFCIKASLSKC